MVKYRVTTNHVVEPQMRYKKMKYTPNEPVVLEMLEGNDWRFIKTTYYQAVRLLKRTHHRGYLLYREGRRWDENRT